MEHTDRDVCVRPTIAPLGRREEVTRSWGQEKDGRRRGAWGCCFVLLA
jgi:hypothetical protein